MPLGSESEITDKSRLVFGAGFAFGVTCSLLLMAVVLVTVDGGQMSLGSPVMITAGAGALFASVVGAALYLLAFPENRLMIPIATETSDEEQSEPGQPTAQRPRDLYLGAAIPLP